MDDYLKKQPFADKRSGFLSGMRPDQASAFNNQFAMSQLEGQSALNRQMALAQQQDKLAAERIASNTVNADVRAAQEAQKQAQDIAFATQNGNNPRLNPATNQPYSPQDPAMIGWARGQVTNLGAQNVASQGLSRANAASVGGDLSAFESQTVLGHLQQNPLAQSGLTQAYDARNRQPVLANESTVLSNQGLGIRNKTAQSELDYLPTKRQQDETKLNSELYSRELADDGLRRQILQRDQMFLSALKQAENEATKSAFMPINGSIYNTGSNTYTTSPEQKFQEGELGRPGRYITAPPRQFDGVSGKEIAAVVRKPAAVMDGATGFTNRPVNSSFERPMQEPSQQSVLMDKTAVPFNTPQPSTPYPSALHQRVSSLPTNLTDIRAQNPSGTGGIKTALEEAIARKLGINAGTPQLQLGSSTLYRTPAAEVGKLAQTQQFTDWWNSLTPEEQATLMKSAVIGGTVTQPDRNSPLGGSIQYHR
jgi:hypothetical protein